MSHPRLFMARNRDHVFTVTYRAATVRERSRPTFFQQPVRSEEALYYYPSVSSQPRDDFHAAALGSDGFAACRSVGQIPRQIPWSPLRYPRLFMALLLLAASTVCHAQEIR